MLSEPLSLHTTRQFLVATEEGQGLGQGQGLAPGHGLPSQRAREARRRARTHCQTVWGNAVAAAKDAGGARVAGAGDGTSALPVAPEAPGLADTDRDRPAATATAGRAFTTSGARDGGRDEGLIIIDRLEEADTWTRPLLDACEDDVAKAIEQRLCTRRKTPPPPVQGNIHDSHTLSIQNTP